MIAVDTSSMIAFLRGDEGTDVARVAEALSKTEVCLPPLVVSELLSHPRINREIRDIVLEMPQLSIGDGYWERTGATRMTVMSKGRRAALADLLICQSCLDHDVPLITRDDDFKVFANACGLRLA